MIQGLHSFPIHLIVSLRARVKDQGLLSERKPQFVRRASDAIECQVQHEVQIGADQILLQCDHYNDFRPSVKAVRGLKKKKP